MAHAYICALPARRSRAGDCRRPVSESTPNQCLLNRKDYLIALVERLRGSEMTFQSAADHRAEQQQSSLLSRLVDEKNHPPDVKSERCNQNIGQNRSEIIMSLQTSGGAINAEETENFEEIEKQFAVKVVDHMTTYWAILEKMPGSKLRLTKFDDEILEHFNREFPDFDLKGTINEDDMKSKAGKERWRNFIQEYEKKVEDYNYGTMLRANAAWEYGEKETIFAVRMQFYAVEIARNRAGLNDWIYRHGKEHDGMVEMMNRYAHVTTRLNRPTITTGLCMPRDSFCAATTTPKTILLSPTRTPQSTTCLIHRRGSFRTRGWQQIGICTFLACDDSMATRYQHFPTALAAGLAPVIAVLTGKVFQGFVEYAAGNWTREKLHDEETNFVLLLMAAAISKWLIHSLVFKLWISLGEMQAKAARDKTFFALASAQPLGSTIQLTLEAALQLAQALYYSWDLALVTLATAPLIAIAVMYLGQKMQAALAKQNAVLTEGQKSTTCAIKGIETVKFSNAQRVEVGRYSRTVEVAARCYRRVARLAALEIALVSLLSIFMFTQGFSYGIILLDKNAKTSEDVMTAFLSAMGAFQALHNVVPHMIVLEKGRMAGSSLSVAMAELVDGRDMQNAKRILHRTTCTGSISLRNLSFAYPLRPQQLALRGITMSIPAGEIVFLIGKSGSGKSTIGQLLVGLYSGLSHICIDGISLDSLDSAWLRSKITLVEQGSILFNDTIFQNIAMSKTMGFTKMEAKEAIDFAALQDMVANMPIGLHTMLDRHGRTISGGQRQRIALARARLRDTPILILDESTSALDFKNRSLVEKGYRCELEETPCSLFRAFVAGVRHQVDPQSHDVRRVDPTKHLRLETSSTHLIEVLTTQKYNSLDPRASHLEGVGHTNASCMSAIEVQVNTESCKESPEVSGTRSLPACEKGSPLQSHSQAITMPSIGDRSLHVCEVSGKIHASENGHNISPAVKVALLPCEKPIAGNKFVTKIASHNGEKSSYVAILATVWPHLDGPQKFRLVLGFWGATIHAAATPVFSYLLAKLLSMYGMPEDVKPEALSCLTAILGVGIIDSIHAYMFRYCLEFVAQSWVDSVRKEAFERILNQPQHFFEMTETSVSQLTNSLDQNAEEMRNIMGQFVPLIYIATIIALISAIWAMFAQWRLTLVVVCMTPCMMLVTRICARVTIEWQKLSNDAADTTFNIFAETCTKIKTVRILLLEAHFSKRYITASNHALKIGFKRSIYTGIAYGASTSLSDVVSEILGYIPQIGDAKDKASRLSRLARLSDHPPESWGYMSIAAVGNIELHDLSFAYPTRPEQIALRNVSLSLRPATITAIVGSSGSGKSTIINLLLRLYNSDPSEITIDGRDVRDIDTTSLRSLVVPVFQTTFLFPATVAENISYGLGSKSPYNSLVSISLAAEKAGIHNFIESLPYGYDTLIGEGGLGLSGGQARRIAIARALVREPAVLVLDEATSALDVESAAIIRETIKKLATDPCRPMTVIMATHNTDMMKIADKIIVLEKGRVVEAGRFGELAAKDGALAKLPSGCEDPAEKPSWRDPFSSGTEHSDLDELI
nr:isoform 3 of phosphatidylcholine translocator abcb4 [Quercus suber]